jgi:hypothetical protein
MARTSHFTTTTAAPAAALLSGASVFLGVAAASGEAAAFFIKLWWEGTGTLPPTTPGGLQPATNAPVAGTTVPHMTIQVPTTGLLLTALAEPINNGGRIWFWITSLKADSDTTALPTGGDVITFIYD